MADDIVEEATDDSRSALHKQRRFLYLMSLAVIAFYALGASVNTEAHYNGFLIKLTTPSRAVIGLWIVWGWALLRYAQCIYEARGRVGKEIKESARSEDIRMALARATRTARRQAKEGYFDADARTGVRVVGKVRGKGGYVSVQPLTLDSTPTYTITSDGGRKYERLGVTLRTNESPSDEVPYQLEISPRGVRWLRIRAWLHAAIRLPAFTDHVAPLAVATIAAFAPLIWQ